MAKKELQISKGKKHLAWHTRSAEVRHKLGLPQQSAPWSSRQGVALRGLPDSARQRDVLDVGFAHMCKKTPEHTGKDIVKGLWGNPSQGVDRVPVTYKPATFSSGLEQYSYERDVVLSTAVHLRCVGWGKYATSQEVYSEAELRTLSADCFSVPLAAAVTTSFFLNPHAPWWK